MKKFASQDNFALVITTMYWGGLQIRLNKREGGGRLWPPHYIVVPHSSQPSFGPALVKLYVYELIL